MKAQLKANRLVYRYRQRIARHALWLRLSKRTGALIRPRTPDQSVLKYWEYWPSGRSAGQRFFLGNTINRVAIYANVGATLKPIVAKDFFHCGRVVAHTSVTENGATSP